MNKSILLFSSILLLSACGEQTEADSSSDVTSEKVEVSVTESIAESNDPPVTSSNFLTFTSGVDKYYHVQGDDQNYANISGNVTSGNSVYVIDKKTGAVYTFGEVINGEFELSFNMQGIGETKLIITTDDIKGSIVDDVDSLENTIQLAYYPNPNTAINESEQDTKESIVEESVVAEEVEVVEKPIEEENTSTDISREYINALGSANDYLNYSSFSKQGLYDQLLFEEYPEDAVQYAIDNVVTDWNENALGAANDYLNYSSFSEQGLYDQLLFEEYTEEEAQYAMDNIVTDWNENALQAAIDYLEYSSFSDQELYDQLLFEGYSAEQAQYAIDNLS